MTYLQTLRFGELSVQLQLPAAQRPYKRFEHRVTYVKYVRHVSVVIACGREIREGREGVGM